MLVKAYAMWIDTASQAETARIWTEMKNSGAFAPLMPHEIQENAFTP